MAKWYKLNTGSGLGVTQQAVEVHWCRPRWQLGLRILDHCMLLLTCRQTPQWRQFWQLTKVKECSVAVTTNCRHLLSVAGCQQLCVAALSHRLNLARPAVHRQLLTQQLTTSPNSHQMKRTPVLDELREGDYFVSF